MMQIKTMTFMNCHRHILLSCKMSALPIHEDCILQKSIEFFSDPEPCFIHRSAVMTRILAEMDEFLYNLSKEGILEIMWTDFPGKFRDMLDMENGVTFIRLSA